MRRKALAGLLISACACATTVVTSVPRPRADALLATYPGRGVGRLPDSVQKRFNLDTMFYAKYASADGIPVIASALVPDAAPFPIPRRNREDAAAVHL